MESPPWDSSCLCSKAYGRETGKKAKQMGIHQHCPCPRRQPTISSHKHSKSPGIHSVRNKKKNPTMKHSFKANKLPVAPLPPVPKRIYTVDSADFKSVVQKLTGATCTRRLRRLAPPPLDVPAASAARSCLTGPTTIIPPDQHLTALHDKGATHADLTFEPLADVDSGGCCQKQVTVTTDESSAKADNDGDHGEDAFSWCLPHHYSPYVSCSGDYHFLSPGTMASLDPMNSVLYS